jgi:hypothetical protein
MVRPVRQSWSLSVSCYTKLTLIGRPVGDEPRSTAHHRLMIGLSYSKGKAKLKAHFHFCIFPKTVTVLDAMAYWLCDSNTNWQS